MADLVITFGDVDNSYEKTLDPGTQDWIETKIAEGIRSLFGKCKGLPRRIDDGDVDPELVKDKVIAAVLRVVRNPLGFESETEGSYSYERNPMVASGDIWYPQKDLDELGCGTSANAVRSVRAQPTPGWGYPS